MKFLIDTNVFIPLEPEVGLAADTWTPAAVAFSRAATGTGQQLFVHPAARKDIDRIRRADLKATRLIQFDKYAELPEPPEGDSKTRSVLGEPVYGGNDWVDDQLLVALYRDAADYLVSEDDAVHRKAARLGLADRALRLRDAAELINRLVTRHAEPAPLVVLAKVHSLLRDDPIFETLRSDYRSDFDDWFGRAARAHRDAWYIQIAGGGYSAVAIVKISDARLPERHLKLCCFKIAEADQGKKYGELMLRHVFDHCYANDLVSCYTTVFPKHAVLVALLEQFGFREQPDRTELGESVYAKRMVPDSSEQDPLGFHVAFGPRHVVRNVPAHIVPIQPKYDAVLFPAQPDQLSFFPQDQPFGNAILKAYLCNASTRQLQAGHNLFFYRSRDERCIRHTGVVEATLVSQEPVEIARFVGTRTVYSLGEIEELCNRPVLAIKFRHSRTLRDGITLETLLNDRILQGAPQSIQRLPEEARDGLWALVDARAERD